MADEAGNELQGIRGGLPRQWALGGAGRPAGAKHGARAGPGRARGGRSRRPGTPWDRVVRGCEGGGSTPGLGLARLGVRVVRGDAEADETERRREALLRCTRRGA